MKTLKLSWLVGCIVMLAGGMARADVIANFDTQSSGTVTPFSVSIATFTSSPSDDAFSVTAVAPLVPASYSGPLSGNMLYETGNLETLTISFSTPVTNPQFDLLISDSSAVNLTTNTGINVGLNGGVLDPGDPNSKYETGVTILDTLTSITLTGGTGVQIGIDNLQGTFSATPTVPEPGTLALAIGALAPTAWGLRRRSARR